MIRRHLASLFAGAALAANDVTPSWAADRPPSPPAPFPSSPTAATTTTMKDKVTKTDAEWQKLLTPEQYRILRQKGTERAFTGEFWNHHDAGVYRCAGCGLELFHSTSKFDSGCGWPSYDRPAEKGRITTAADYSLGMQRTEVLCSRCGGHLGHVFNDGPAETTGLRYCINSAALKFQKKEPGQTPGSEASTRKPPTGR